ncbi:MAG: HAD-IA family hydrolase [bacterium]|nr:HAD-IA family hydrolase [bacterium]
MIVRPSLSRNKIPAFSIKPDFYADSAGDIDFKYLKKLGIKTCLIDLDGTVVERDMFDVHPSVIKHLRSTDVKVFIATNRPKSRHLKNLKNDLSAAGVIHPVGFHAKPTKKYFYNAMEITGSKPTEVLMIGDRLLQDILGSNRVGIHSLMVKKLGPDHNFKERIVSKIQNYLTKNISKSYIRSD